MYGLMLMTQSEAPENVRLEATDLLNASLPLLLRFISDRNHEVPMAVSGMVGDLLRTVSLMSLQSVIRKLMTHSTKSTTAPPRQRAGPPLARCHLPPTPFPCPTQNDSSSLLSSTCSFASWPGLRMPIGKHLVRRTPILETTLPNSSSSES